LPPVKIHSDGVATKDRQPSPGLWLAGKESMENLSAIYA
jgi:hypothetical protein